jgi:hypothetical protein
MKFIPQRKNLGAFLGRPEAAQKPGFPLQVLGFAYANPVGFPLQSLARLQPSLLAHTGLSETGVPYTE